MKKFKFSLLGIEIYYGNDTAPDAEEVTKKFVNDFKANRIKPAANILGYNVFLATEIFNSQSAFLSGHLKVNNCEILIVDNNFFALSETMQKTIIAHEVSKIIFKNNHPTNSSIDDKAIDQMTSFLVGKDNVIRYLQYISNFSCMNSREIRRRISYLNQK